MPALAGGGAGFETRGEEIRRIRVVEILSAGRLVPVGWRLERPLQQDARVAQVEFLGVRVVLVGAVQAAVKALCLCEQLPARLQAPLGIDAAGGAGGLPGGVIEGEGERAHGAVPCGGRGRRSSHSARHPAPGRCAVPTAETEKATH